MFMMTMMMLRKRNCIVCGSFKPHF